MRNAIYLVENQPKAIRIKDRCGHHWNLGAICKTHAVLDLQSKTCKGGRYLIGEIAAAGGDFTALIGYKKSRNGATHCWSGSSYEGGVRFESIGLAVRYLKKYFNVFSCDKNAQYDQNWINKQ